MPKFIREYVYCLMDNSLIGKEGFFADNASTLKHIVNINALACRGRISDVVDESDTYPFLRAGTQSRYKFFYYDPYWDLKCAVENGERLEVNTRGEWVEVIDLKGFLSNYNQSISPEKYRIVPKGNPVDRIVSHKELTKWLATGHGQVRASLGDNPKMYVVSFGYSEELDDKPVENLLVRSWDDVAWHLPTASYLGLGR